MIHGSRIVRIPYSLMIFKMKRFILALSLAYISAPSADAVNYRGDFNRDSKVDMHDMSALTLALKGGSPDVKLFDLNADGVVDDRDLEALANVILTQSLVEDTGVNVGIGGWDNGGEWGGTVGRPPIVSPRGAEASVISLYGRNGYDYISDGPRTGIYLNSDGPVSGLLIDFGVPAWDDFEMDENSVVLNEELAADHRLYGKMAKIIQRDSPVVRYRVIVYSPSLKPLNLSDRPLLEFRYAKDGLDRRDMPFTDCQAVLPDSGKVVDVPWCYTELWWDYVPVRDIVLSETSVAANPGEYVEIGISWKPEDASGKDYEVASSDEGIVTVSGAWGNKVILSVVSEGTASITIHTTDGSDITKTIHVANGADVETVGAEDSVAGSTVYTIQGFPLGILDRDALKALPSGLYISNGHKLHIP